jgi:hypothetical protein
MIHATAGTYVSETLPPCLRGPGLALWPLTILLGALIASIVVATSQAIPGAGSYRTCFAAQWPFVALVLAVAIFAPESPAWLVRTGRTERARKAFARLDSSPSEAEREAAFAELQAVLDFERKQAAVEEVSYGQCFRGVDRRRSLIVVFTAVVPELFGLPLLSTASYFMQTIGMDTNVSLIFIIIGVVLGIVSNVLAFWILTAVGRRPLLITGLSIASVLWLSVAIAGFFSTSASIWYVLPLFIRIRDAEADHSWVQVHRYCHDGSHSFSGSHFLASRPRRQWGDFLSPTPGKDERCSGERDERCFGWYQHCPTVHLQPRPRQPGWQDGVSVCGYLRNMCGRDVGGCSRDEGSYDSRD